MKQNNREEFWKRRFEKASREYSDDFSIALWSEHSHKVRLETFFQVFHQHPLKTGSTILDLGCGPGTYSFLLKDMGYDVYAADYSSSMVLKAREKSGGRDIQFQTADLYSLPFQKNTFDAVICMGVFQYVTNETMAIREIRQVLNNEDGVVFLSVPNSLSIRSLFKRGIQFLKEPPSLRKTENTVQSAAKRYNPYRLKKILAGSGLTDVSIYGIYLLPDGLLPLESVMRKYQIFRFIDRCPFIRFLVAHDYLVKASVD